jgi:NTE family protein
VSETSDTAADPDGPTAALAWPISFDARYGDGLGHTLVLGGGGLFFVAWQVAYLQALEERGLQLSQAQRVVGTSAGSLVATIVTAGRLRSTADEIDLLAKVPGIVAHLAGGGGDLAPSQERAVDLFRIAPDAEVARVREIGHAALAAHAPPTQKIRRSLGAVLGVRRWPGEQLHITAVDTFTAERLVITKASGIPVAVAAAASSAVPGVFTPQSLHDRRAMDGGVSGTGMHADLVAGADRALVLSLAANLDLSVGAMTSAPDAQAQELAALAASGTQVLVKGPREVDEDALMDPKAVAGAIELGQQQAADDADEVLAIWS